MLVVLYIFIYRKLLDSLRFFQMIRICIIGLNTIHNKYPYLWKCKNQSLYLILQVKIIYFVCDTIVLNLL